jgi:creatinine amidohydrolase
VLFNTHGGQAGFMDIVGRDLRMRLGLTVYCVNWYQLPLLDTSGEDLAQRFSAHEHRFGAHAGQIETSLMLALHPELVDMGQAQNFASTSEQRAAKFDILGNGKSAKLAWAAQDYNPAGAMGNAAAATAETGRAVRDAAGAALAKLLAQIAQA